MVPMFASSIAVVTNTALNFLLIFGFVFLPHFRVRGAAISTLIARIVECAITMYWVHRHEEEESVCHSGLPSIPCPFAFGETDSA